MSKSLSVYILLPMDHYNERDVYEEDFKLRQMYGEAPRIDPAMYSEYQDYLNDSKMIL